MAASCRARAPSSTGTPPGASPPGRTVRCSTFPASLRSAVAGPAFGALPLPPPPALCRSSGCAAYPGRGPSACLRFAAWAGRGTLPPSTGGDRPRPRRRPRRRPFPGSVFPVACSWFRVPGSVFPVPCSGLPFVLVLVVGRFLLPAVSGQPSAVNSRRRATGHGLPPPARPLSIEHSALNIFHFAFGHWPAIPPAPPLPPLRADRAPTGSASPRLAPSASSRRPSSRHSPRLAGQ